jgi:hypothetical protein
VAHEAGGRPESSAAKLPGARLTLRSRRLLGSPEALRRGQASRARTQLMPGRMPGKLRAAPTETKTANAMGAFAGLRAQGQEAQCTKVVGLRSKATSSLDEALRVEKSSFDDEASPEPYRGH